ncbi:unnamed protein product, partial [Closterium sp. NIES-54]
QHPPQTRVAVRGNARIDTNCEKRGKEDTRVAGPPPTRVAGPPPTRVAGPPPTRVAGPPPTRVAGPPPTRVAGPPPTRVAGPPPTHRCTLSLTTMQCSTRLRLVKCPTVTSPRSSNSSPPTRMYPHSPGAGDEVAVLCHPDSTQELTHGHLPQVLKLLLTHPHRSLLRMVTLPLLPLLPVLPLPLFLFLLQPFLRLLPLHPPLQHVNAAHVRSRESVDKNLAARVEAGMRLRCMRRHHRQCGNLMGGGIR